MDEQHEKSHNLWRLQLDLSNQLNALLLNMFWVFQYDPDV